MSGDKRNSHSTDVLISEGILALSPKCEHGPTLLFEKYSRDGPVQSFFACSAYRDRKHCQFYQPFLPDGGNISQRSRNTELRKLMKKPATPNARLLKARSLRAEERLFCHSCNALTFNDQVLIHRGHVITEGISNWLLDHPSQLLHARDGNKSQAQYLFSEGTTKFLVKTIASLGFDKVLCVGVPRLHEALKRDKSTLRIDSLLLDIDERFAQFLPPSEYCRYNMFNHHFLDDSEDTLRSFMGGGIGDHRIVLVMDPPFGGLVEALVYGISRITQSYQQESSSDTELPVLWIFPYFLEKRITAVLPGFKMLDYKVCYDNHILFRNGSRSKKSSPVRIFTNIDPVSVVLPSAEGYRLCRKCQRYSAAENHHCPRCKQCPSKDGSTYHHCDLCDRCVKPSYTHCHSCRKCELPSHDCLRVLVGCHLCGDQNHKRKDCPQQQPLHERIKIAETRLKSRLQTGASARAGEMSDSEENSKSSSPDHPLQTLLDWREQTNGDRSSLKRNGSQTNLGPQMGHVRQRRRHHRTNLSAKCPGDYITNYVKRRRLSGLKSTFQF